MDKLYSSLPILICFDNEGSDAEFTPEQQSRINAMLAENKRGIRSQLEKTERQLAELTESKSLTEQERESLAEALEETRTQLRTKEENEKIERQRSELKHKREIESYKKRAETAETKYRDARIHSALSEAAVAGDAFNPIILVEVLKADTSMDSDGNVTVAVKSKDADGNESIAHLSATEAVKAMKGRPDQFGGLFRQFVAPKESAPTGKLDYKTMTPEQYRELRRTNPGALGL